MTQDASSDSACLFEGFLGLGVAGVAVGVGVVEETRSVACPFDPNAPNGGYHTEMAPSGGPS